MRANINVRFMYALTRLRKVYTCTIILMQKMPVL